MPSTATVCRPAICSLKPADCDMGFRVGGLLSHYANSPNHAWCHHCRTEYFNHGALRIHMDIEHPRCSICNDTFVNEFGLHEHRRQSHGSSVQSH